MSSRDVEAMSGDPYAVFWNLNQQVLRITIDSVRGSPGTNKSLPVASATVLETLRGKPVKGTIELSFRTDGPEPPDTISSGGDRPEDRAYRVRQEAWLAAAVVAPAAGSELFVILDGDRPPLTVRPDGIFGISYEARVREGIAHTAKIEKQAADEKAAAHDAERAANEKWAASHARANVESLARRAELVAVAHVSNHSTEGGRWTFQVSSLLHGKRLIKYSGDSYFFAVAVDAETNEIFERQRDELNIDVLFFLTKGAVLGNEPVYELVSSDAIMRADPALVTRARAALK